MNDKWNQDPYLMSLVQTVRYLAPFFPAYEADSQPYVPFVVKICRDAVILRDACRTSDSWPAVYESLPMLTETEKYDGPTTVISGTLRFFQLLASKVRPIGRLNNDDGFRRQPALLHLFCRELNEIVGGTVCFLFGGFDSISTIDDVSLTITSGLLCYIAAPFSGPEQILQFVTATGSNHVLRHL